MAYVYLNKNKLFLREMDINIEMDENFDVLLSNLDSDLYPSFFQSSSVGRPRPVFREIPNEELEVEEETTN